MIHSTAHTHAETNNADAPLVHLRLRLLQPHQVQQAHQAQRQMPPASWWRVSLQALYSRLPCCCCHLRSQAPPEQGSLQLGLRSLAVAELGAWPLLRRQPGCFLAAGWLRHCRSRPWVSAGSHHKALSRSTGLAMPWTPHMSKALKKIVISAPVLSVVAVSSFALMPV